MAEYIGSQMMSFPALDSIKPMEIDNPKLRQEAGLTLKSIKDLDDPRDQDYVQKDYGTERTLAERTADATRAALTEGHTWWDAILSNSCTTVGQVILTEPYQFARTGIIPSVILYMGSNILSFYTMFLLIVLFLHRKKQMIKEGTWFTTTDEHGFLRRGKATQFYDIIEYTLGRNLAIVAQVCVAIQVLNSGAVQIIASASSQYEISPQYNKRTWSLILGPVLLIFGYLPTFRSSRVLNLIGLVGTQYSTLYFTISAIIKGYTPGAITRRADSKLQFFTGAASVGTGQSHGTALEMMDAMRQSRKYTVAYGISWLWIIILMVPHSLAISLSYNKEVLKQSNVYAILPDTGFRTTSIYIMLVHNIAAFTLHIIPLMFLWERIIGVHEKSYWIRLPLRTPPLLFVWLLAIMLPFYGNVSSVYSSVTGFLVSHVFPGLAFTYFYRNKEQRDACPVKIPRIFAAYNWAPMLLLNMLIAGFYGVCYCGFGTYYSWVLLIQNVHQYKIFAPCFQCASASSAKAG